MGRRLPLRGPLRRDDGVWSIALDSSESPIIVGLTYSPNLPTTFGAFDTSYNSPGIQDAFVVRLDAGGGTVEYATYLGGVTGDAAVAVEVDAADIATVAGYVNSSNFPTTPGALDSSFNGATADFFVTRLWPYIALGPAGAGSIGLGQGGPFNVLSVNGSFGLPSRRVDVATGSPITIDVAQPPTNPLPAPFVIVGLIETPTAADAFVLPLGIGTLCFPPPQLDPGFPGTFTLTNNFGPDAQLMGSSPTPWTFTAPGLPFPFQFTLQGLIQQDPGTVRVTNGIIVSVL